MAFTVYTAPFCIDPDNEYIIYVRLTDKAGNTDYICSDGIVLDGTSPVITGIENGKTYCEAQTVTVDEKHISTVTVNGTEVTLDENGSFVLSPADGGQKIVVTDKAGNTAEMNVTVNDGHTFGDWTSNGDGTHTRQCTADGCTEGVETDNCTDEDKNHKCDICGKIISNHIDLKHFPAKGVHRGFRGQYRVLVLQRLRKYTVTKTAPRKSPSRHCNGETAEVSSDRRQQQPHAVDRTAACQRRSCYRHNGCQQKEKAQQLTK